MLISEEEIGRLPLGTLLSAIAEQSSETSIAAMKIKRRAGGDEDFDFLLLQYKILRVMMLSLCRHGGISYGMFMNGDGDGD